MKTMQRHNKIRGGIARWQLRRVQAEVDAHLSETISNQQLADCVWLSRWHFARAFRQSTGMSPRSYVRRRRIDRAQRLMLTTDATLSEIALECGLSDQSHLGRTFVKALGVTPGAWRRAHLARGQSPTQLNDRIHQPLMTGIQLIAGRQSRTSA